jgi:hypothetical protein
VSLKTLNYKNKKQLKTKKMNKIETIEQANVVLINYLKDNNEKLRIQKIKDANYELKESQESNIYKSLNLGRLISESLSEFNSPEAKQERKNLGLKIGVEYFLEQAYSFKKSWAYKLIKAYELGGDVHKEYLNSGNVDKELSIAGLLKFANPTEESTEESTEGNSEGNSEESTEESNNKTIKIGAITINLGNASKEDILKAAEYLQNLAK